MPDQDERYNIWQSSIPPKATLEENMDLQTISRKYEISGSAIVSVIHYASLQTIYKNSTVISEADIIEGIKKEYEKVERVFRL